MCVSPIWEGVSVGSDNVDSVGVGGDIDHRSDADQSAGTPLADPVQSRLGDRTDEFEIFTEVGG